jgi:uroporphyrin-III C-methyltransferase
VIRILLTVRAQRLISTADAVFHDDLVPQSILQLCRPNASVVSVGKRCGNRSITQEQINQTLVTAARSGKSVGRLKSGDPMLYGRATEELTALEREQIRCEVIPGVSALFPVAASMRLPLTDRLSASRLIVLTGQRAAEQRTMPLWEGAFPQDATIAIYMPGSDYSRLQESLSDSGLPRDMPCLIVSCAGTEWQQSVHTTLELCILRLHFRLRQFLSSAATMSRTPTTAQLCQRSAMTGAVDDRSTRTAHCL